MATSETPPAPPGGRPLARAAQVIVVSGVMFTFISAWRTAAVVLCDLASTAYYIGGIVEQAIGPAAPWFILAVMLFSYAVRSVYIESCSLFVRGGVYRVVKEAMGGFLAKLSVSALMFDYVLTGPISGVSAGQYLVGLGLETFGHVTGRPPGPAAKEAWKAWGAAAIACLVTLYFFRQNLLGIHEASGKAVKIMIATTVMAAVLLTWCGISLLAGMPRSGVPLAPDFHQTPDPLGLLGGTGPGEAVRNLSGAGWLSLVGVAGVFIAFGHSILAMSGEETLAQVYREVESPKLPNFKKAAFIVFVYSLVLTGGISFLAVLLIPNDVRMGEYADNLIAGLAMNVAGPPAARLLLHAFVVGVGFLILAGAVNTAIVGSNGVLNRVAEDGVLPDWFLKPHPRYGTTYRLLYMILGLQLCTIAISRGNVLALGEAYAFGVVWSFVFKALAMVVLRFKDPRPRAFQVPFNVAVGRYQVPVGLGLIFLVLLVSAVMNLLTKETATQWGLGFTTGFLTLFLAAERYNQRQGGGAKHEHLEQFNQVVEEVTPEGLGLTRPRRTLVAVRSPDHLAMLDRALEEADANTTSVVVMHAKLIPPLAGGVPPPALDTHDRQLLTAVVERAEKAGKEVKPVVVPTNNPLHAILTTAKALGTQEVFLGASRNLHVPDVMLGASFHAGPRGQQRRIADYWGRLWDGRPAPLTVRIIGPGCEVRLDLGTAGSAAEMVKEGPAK
ncbi:MAG TPA: amino acid permease [Gemmataceae bacterium]|nr:amino acid permease [Gemmataceae bacterium]